MTTPLITTVIPTYKRPKLLCRAIRSVLAQSYSHFEVHVLDNASGDETRRVVGELAASDPRIKYHCHPENIGAQNNFIYGLQMVQTPLFSLLSDDDVILPGFFEKAVAELEKYPDAAFFAGDAVMIDSAGNVLGAPPLSFWPRDGYYAPPEGLLQMSTRHPNWTSIIFRRMVVEQVGLLDATAGFTSDLDYQLRIAARFPFVISREPYALFTSHPASACSNATHTFLWPGWLKVIHNIVSIEGLSFETQKRFLDIMMNKFNLVMLQFGMRAIENNDKPEVERMCMLLESYSNCKSAAVFLRILRVLHRVHPGIYFGIHDVIKNVRRLKAGKQGSEKQYAHLSKYLDF